jgi:large subunit ribosomal protein L25
METFNLSAQKRKVTKHSARDTRNENRVPAVVYGKGVDPLTISLDYSDILRTYRRTGTSALIDLDIEGNTLKVLVQELKLNPVTDEIQHVDFYAVNLKEKTIVTVPFEFVGESAAIKDQGGIFMKEHDRIDIRCLPTDIPAQIEVDISQIKTIGDSISIADMALDETKYEIMNATPELAICSVAAPRMEEEPTETEGGETDESASEEGDDGKDQKSTGEENEKKE